MAYIKQFGIILGVTFVAEIIRFLVPLPIPAGVYGLVLMLVALKTGLIKLEWVKDAGLFLVGLLQLMFIPAAVGLIDSYAGFSDILPQSILAVLVSTTLVIAATGVVVQRALKRTLKRSDKVKNEPS
ncbi:MAG: CidA/LrgA family protein [Oscillospiraceae bacterium]|nr:CidA/LrgA family protein [Oscillospiraceae bacterium]